MTKTENGMISIGHKMDELLLEFYNEWRSGDKDWAWFQIQLNKLRYANMEWIWNNGPSLKFGKANLDTTLEALGYKDWIVK